MTHVRARTDPTSSEALLEASRDSRDRLTRLSSILMEWPDNKDAEWALRHLVNIWFQQPGWMPEIVLRPKS